MYFYSPISQPRSDYYYPCHMILTVMLKSEAFGKADAERRELRFATTHHTRAQQAQAHSPPALWPLTLLATAEQRERVPVDITGTTSNWQPG